MLNKTCLTCGKKFTVKNSLKRIKFCCKTCVRFSQKVKNKLSKQRRGVPKTEVWKKSASLGRLNEKNPMWKGDNAGVDAIHIWVLRNKPKPKFCIDCKKNKPKDLANISQKYKRDINDFEWLCRKCHMVKDGRLKKFISYKSKFICQK